MLIINDVHTGFERKGGTTPKSQGALRDYLFKSLEDLLYTSQEKHLMVLGDLFDDFEVPPKDWLDTYLLMQDWLVRTNGHLTLVAGNHDWAARGDRVSSFEMMGTVLKEQFGASVTVLGIDQWGGDPDYIALAHCSNQDTFEQKLGEILEVTDPEGKCLLIHANWDNNFAAQSDHSLNVSREQAQVLIDKGFTLVFAHVHQAAKAMAGKVIVLGNQLPTSTSDCLGNDEKFAHVLKGGELTRFKTWSRADGGYAEVDWRDLASTPSDHAQFIRVQGSATSGEASEVVSAISSFRQVSNAFVITNAVSIEGIVESAELPESFDAAMKFDVMEFIKDHLEADEMRAVEKLMEAQQ